LLASHQPCPTPETRKIAKFDLIDAVTMNPTTTAATHRAFAPGPDRDPKIERPLTDTDHVDIGQADKKLAHASRVRFQL
jgi:hypothetical protein